MHPNTVVTLLDRLFGQLEGSFCLYAISTKTYTGVFVKNTKKFVFAYISLIKKNLSKCTEAPSYK